MSDGVWPATPSLTLRVPPGRLVVGLVLALLLAAGCKSKGGGSGGAGGSGAGSDPLVVGPGRIPKQSLPIPSRGTGTAGVDGKSDPLLGSPTSRPGNRTGAGYTDDPGRWKKGPYVPGPGGTPAALATRPADDGDGLRIDVAPAGGVAPAGAAEATGADAPYAELAAYGVKRGDATVSRDGGQVVVTVRVPISGDGRVRGYTGAGPTEAAAVQQVVEQVRADRK